MKRCLLFDSDGTLVDSELLNCEAMSAELSVNEAALDLVRRFCGWMLVAVFDDIQQRHGVLRDANFTERFRVRVGIFPGIYNQPSLLSKRCASWINQLCMASNAPPKKLNLVLSTTGLARFFSSIVFSAYEISSWKPNPALFLHAARNMG